MNGRDFDYIVVGSGAGGGPLAANLAEGRLQGAAAGGGRRSAEPRHDCHMYEVPCLPRPSPPRTGRCAWDFFVRHYADDAQQQDATSSQADANDGVLYPRAGTLGGCTAHNAMITVYPHNSDWDHIAELTGDDSWRATKCGTTSSGSRTAITERLEEAAEQGPDLDPSRHGYRAG